MRNNQFKIGGEVHRVCSLMDRTPASLTGIYLRFNSNNNDYIKLSIN